MKNYKINTQYSILDSRYWKRGQILLILTMLIAIAITVVLNISFSAKTDSQLTKLEQDNQMAFAAAEAGVEHSLKNGDVADLTTIGNLAATISSGKSTVTSASSTTFVSPALSIGEAFTFYLGTFNPSTKLISNPSSDNKITIAYNSSGTPVACNSIVLDIAVLNNATGVTRYLADTGNNFNSSTAQIGTSSGGPFTVNGIDYQCITSAIPVTAASGPKMMLVRFISVSGGPTSTSLGFTGDSILPVSGQTITSQATTRTGVTKKIQLFQSYPQIPAEFFFTSF